MYYPACLHPFISRSIPQNRTIDFHGIPKENVSFNIVFLQEPKSLLQ